VFKFGGRLGLCTLQFFVSLYCISCYIVNNVSIKFGGMNKHCLFVCLFACFCIQKNFVLLFVDWI
jgi:hypothetical protein